MTGASLGDALLFSLFSFLFGGGLAAFRETARAFLSALGLLPLPFPCASPFPRLEKKKKRPKKEKPTPKTTPPAKIKPTPKENPTPKAKLTPKEKAVKARKKSAFGRPAFFFGYLVLDLSFFVFGASFYMLFLYAENGGVFRLYGFLLTVCGFLLLRPVLFRLLARPLARLLFFLFSLFRFCLLLFFFPLFSARFRFERKTPKRLDGETKMV